MACRRRHGPGQDPAGPRARAARQGSWRARSIPSRRRADVGAGDLAGEAERLRRTCVVLLGRPSAGVGGDQRVGGGRGPRRHSYAVARIDDVAIASVPWAVSCSTRAQFRQEPSLQGTRGDPATAGALRPGGHRHATRELTHGPSGPSWRWPHRPLSAGRHLRRSIAGRSSPAASPSCSTGFRTRIRPLMLRRTKSEVAPTCRRSRCARHRHEPAARAHLLTPAPARAPARARPAWTTLRRTGIAILSSLTRLRPARPGARRRRARRGRLGQDRRPRRAPHRAPSGGAPGAGLQPVHPLPAGGSRRASSARASPRPTSTARRPTARTSSGLAQRRPDRLPHLAQGRWLRPALTEANYVFVLDPLVEPAAEAQAIDRTHRIGQTSRSWFIG